MSPRTETAAQAVVRRRNQIELLLHQVSKGATALADASQAKPLDWGYAGTLGHVVEQLDALAKFLGKPGLTPEGGR